MSVAETSPTNTDTPNGEADEQSTRPARRRRLRPGNSLLSQGEPWVWLTGSALVIALAMIAFLLALVVWFGATTFWPAPLVRFELASGPAVLGEVARTESFSLTKESIERLNDTDAARAKKWLGERASAIASRRLIRTGNFELTQNHFRWVSDFEVPDGGETRPEWAVALERLEWGRFHGEPTELSERVTRHAGPDEDDISSLLRLLNDHAAKLGESQQAAVQAETERMGAALSTLRAANVRRFLESIDSLSTSGGETGKPSQWQAVLDDNRVIAIDEVEADSNVVELRASWTGADGAWTQFNQRHAAARAAHAEQVRLEKHDLGRVNRRIDEARLRLRAAELAAGVAVLDRVDELRTLQDQLRAQESELSSVDELVSRVSKKYGPDSTVVAIARQTVAAWRAETGEQAAPTQERVTVLEGEIARQGEPLRRAIEDYLKVQSDAAAETVAIQAQIARATAEGARYQLHLVTADGQSAAIPLDQIVRGYPANQLSTSGKWSVYFSRWREFMFDEPREANSEGGVFPALFGTVAMTMIMSLVVVPFGVLAALYLREYAKGGAIVSAVRIAINNLAGVPSIVFGVFGLGFFCYLVGAFVDGGPQNIGVTPLPPKSWYLGLGTLAIVAVSAFVLGLGGASRAATSGWARWASRGAIVLWIAATALVAWLIVVSPYFEGWYRPQLPNPTLGKGGLLWSSLTLALMTLPVVIVATEEALSAVPNSLREGSYGCGAGKWQTIRRIVLPQALPGILTGMILAMARGAGEVAPLMLVGAVKLAPELPIDLQWPLVHVERSFMHLGFHIYDLGFQSQNSEAAKPMVFTTTLLLIVLIFVLNVSAVWLRTRLRRRFKMGHF